MMKPNHIKKRYALHSEDAAQAERHERYSDALVHWRAAMGFSTGENAQWVIARIAHCENKLGIYKNIEVAA